MRAIPGRRPQECNGPTIRLPELNKHLKELDRSDGSDDKRAKSLIENAN